MQKPRFRTTVAITPPPVKLDTAAHQPLYERIGINPRKLEDPAEVDVRTNYDVLGDEYGIFIPFLDDEEWDLHDGSEWQGIMFAKVLDIHHARVEVARAPALVREQFDNLMRLTDHDNINTLAETIRDTLRIARADVQDTLRAIGLGE